MEIVNVGLVTLVKNVTNAGVDFSTTQNVKVSRLLFPKCLFVMNENTSGLQNVTAFWNTLMILTVMLVMGIANVNLVMMGKLVMNVTKDLVDILTVEV